MDDLTLASPSDLPVADHEVPDRQVPDHELLARLCALAAGIDVGTARMLALVGEVDAREAWGGPGIKSCAHWLSWKCGIGTVTARTHVRVARALRSLPLVRGEFNAGRLSYAKVRALTRIADADNEDDLVTLAHASTAAQFERTVRAWRLVDDLAAADTEPKREVRWHWDTAGMFVLTARLTADDGAIILTALEAVRIRTTEPTKSTPSTEPAPSSEPTAPVEAGATVTPPGRRSPPETIPRDRARAESTPIPESPIESPIESVAVSHADALVGLARGFLDPHGDIDCDPQVQVIVHVDSTVLTHEAHGGLAAYDAGRAISANTARRLTCDSQLIAMLHADGDVLDTSKPTRRISHALRRALTARDHGCAFPSCTETRPTRLQAHHVQHWADGGETRISNLVLLCRYHHRTIHLDGYRITITRDARRFDFVSPHGTRLDPLPAQPLTRTDLPIADPALIPTWRGEPFQLAYVISVLRDRRNHRTHTRQKHAEDQATARRNNLAA
jgi:hypothetical protein